jgi:hypothetical protein
MITHRHDHGWGPQWPIKRIEQELTDAYLAPLAAGRDWVVTVNSTWYGQDQHAQTLQWLRNNPWDILVLVSMIDSAIPAADWFAEFDRPVIAVGSYPGPHHVSLWAEAVARHIQPYLDHDITVPFMCLNRKPHWHRVRLYHQLAAAGILDQGLVSLGGADTKPAVRTLPESVPDNDLAPNGAIMHHGIVNDIMSLGDLGHWRRHFLNIVTETVFDVDHKYFVSEKIFKPVIGARPFLVYADTGAEQWLQDQGFETYVDDFQDISDFNLRDPDCIAPFLTKLCAQGVGYYQKKYLALLPKILYNQHRFSRFVAEQKMKIQQGISCPI